MHPVTLMSVRIERFGSAGNLFFTVRNNRSQFASGIVVLDIQKLGIAPGIYPFTNFLEAMPVKIKRQQNISGYSGGEDKGN